MILPFENFLINRLLIRDVERELLDDIKVKNHFKKLTDEKVLFTLDDHCSLCF
jgi:hypothetical protein